AFVYTEPSGTIVRTYRVSAAGRLVGYRNLSNGDEITISYDGSGQPTWVQGASQGSDVWSWSVSCVAGHIDSITASTGTWVYQYSGGLLTTVTVDGALWRSYWYDDGDRLEEIQDGAGHAIERHEYYSDTHPDFAGWAMTSETADEHIVSIQYRVDPALLDRALNPDSGEFVTRV
ncbi:MAG: hypothetical protein GY842_03955, partial [bacterium]|nr:hypothetical protein [bacterium]